MNLRLIDLMGEERRSGVKLSISLRSLGLVVFAFVLWVDVSHFV